MRAHTTALIEPSAASQPAAQRVTPVRGALLQRKCACGGATRYSGTCGDCWNDKLHHQAHRPAGADHGIAPPTVHEVLNSPGRPLDPETRAHFEPRFGHDFSKVRIYDDASAARSAEVMNAHAYTIGEDIVFGRNQYRPDSTAGHGLVAHELTHVVQQAELGPTLDRKGLQGDEKSAKEIEAKRRERVAVVAREKWGARAPNKAEGWDEYPSDAPLPLYRIVVHHTADPRSQTVSALQNKEMDERHYADLPYHFVITQDGTVNEGRKIEAVGAHAGEIKGNKDIKKDPDYGSIGIVVTGDFQSRYQNLWHPDTPSTGQLSSLYRLTAQLVRDYTIDPRLILNHFEVSRGGDATVCPGENLSPFVARMRSNLFEANKESLGPDPRKREPDSGIAEERYKVAPPDKTAVVGISSQEIENRRFVTAKARQQDKVCGPDVTKWMINQINSNATGAIVTKMQKDNSEDWKGIDAGAAGSWYALNKTGGPWDFKTQLGASIGDLAPCRQNCNGKLYSVTLDNQCMTYEVPANVHYGYVGRAAGFSEQFLLWAASGAQASEGRGEAKDDPRDVQSIKKGFALFTAGSPTGFNKASLDQNYYENLPPGDGDPAGCKPCEKELP